MAILPAPPPRLGRSATLALLLCGAALAVAAPPARTPDTEANRLVFLLEYVGTDYGLAVRGGTVASPAEYAEIQRFVEEIVRAYAARRGARRDAVTTGLAALQAAIARKAPSAEVFAATRALLPELTRAVGGDVRPATLPNLANGRRLWTNDCAPCHGPTGAGDGPSAADLSPAPTAFRGEYLERLTPRQVYNALSLGVDGTGMPSFSLAYTPSQRWDAAFFAMTLRVGFSPIRPPAGTAIGLDELATSSNTDLLARLRATRPDASEEEIDYLRVNLVGPVGSAAPLAGPAATAGGGLSVALQLQDAFVGVAEKIRPRTLGVTSYVADPEWAADRLRATRGEAWMQSNANDLRYAGYRPLHAASGFLVDDDGYVLTTDHVLRDERGELAALVEVETSGQVYALAGIVGAEPTLDLAVLRIADPAQRPAGLPPAELGDSDRLEAGHWVVAVGDPPGTETTFAVGVVASAASRQCYQEHLSATALQTSLQVPESALGGPVADIFGRFVGLNVRPARATARPASASQPAGDRVLTLPSNLIVTLFDALKSAQTHRSPWLGISVLELPALRRRLGAQAATVVFPRTGVYIDDVYDPSPASHAGVRPGDFLLELGGHPLVSVGDFQAWLYALGIGRRVELRLLRDGAPMAVEAPIEERPASARPE